MNIYSQNKDPSQGIVEIIHTTKILTDQLCMLWILSRWVSLSGYTNKTVTAVTDELFDLINEHKQLQCRLVVK